MPSKKKKSKGFRGENKDVAKGTAGGKHQSPHIQRAPNGTRAEPAPEPIPARDAAVVAPSGNESFQNASSRSIRSDGEEDCQTTAQETAPDCPRNGSDSEPPHATNSEDSGFTSSLGNESSREGGEGCDAIHSEQQPAALLDELGIELRYESPSSAPLPTRPGFGRFGKKIRLISNCYPLKVPKANVYHYDVEVVRLARGEAEAVAGGTKGDEKYRCLKTKEKRRVMESVVRRDALFEGLYPAYDGEKSLYTRRPLRGTFPHKFATEVEDGTRAEVTIKPVKKDDTTSCAVSLDALNLYFENQSDSLPWDAVAALETILRHGACLRLTPIGRSFFSPPGPGCLNPLAGGLEIWLGHHQSVRIGQWALTVNVDTTASVFLPGGPLLEYLAQILNVTVDGLRNVPFLPDRDIYRLSRKLKGRKVEATHSTKRRKYTAMKLMRESAQNLSLDGNGLTVRRYFKERYGIDLRYPNLPCLRVKPENRNVYLPVELCKLTPGQHYNEELTQAQKSEMIKFTSCPPKQRFRKIQDHLNFSDDRCVREFDLQVSQEPLHVEGRTLDPPSLIYGSDRKIRPCDGAWNMRNVQFFNGARIGSWALICFADVRGDKLRRFVELLKETGLKLGVPIGDPCCTRPVADWRAAEKELRFAKEKKAYLAIVVLPENNALLYRNIKKSAEIGIGLITQCLRVQTLLRIADPASRCAHQLVANLFLKINVKMGGVNYTLVLSEIPPILWKPTIIIGADVNHPGAYRGLRESLAACVGSLDARSSLYASRTRPQRNIDANKKSIEIILDMELMVADLLRAFYRHTMKQKPEKIIVYRDGVSEGELLKVRDTEVASIRKACRRVGQDYEPGITFVVVQKRHHVRFMTEDAKLNPPPGTVIDRGVTRPDQFDFFLCSQKSPKGTAKPAHYTVVADDNSFTADDLQKLTNQLCYTFSRCTKSISIPAPVACADLAAYRARLHLDAQRGGSSASDSDSLSDHSQMSIEDVLDYTTVMQELKNSMYYV